MQHEQAPCLSCMAQHYGRAVRDVLHKAAPPCVHTEGERRSPPELHPCRLPRCLTLRLEINLALLGAMQQACTRLQHLLEADTCGAHSLPDTSSRDSPIKPGHALPKQPMLTGPHSRVPLTARKRTARPSDALTRTGLHAHPGRPALELWRKLLQLGGCSGGARVSVRSHPGAAGGDAQACCIRRVALVVSTAAVPGQALLGERHLRRQLQDRTGCGLGSVMRRCRALLQLDEAWLGSDQAHGCGSLSVLR